MADETKKENGDEKVEIDKDELDGLKSKAADMDKWKIRAKKAEDKTKELESDLGDLTEKVKKLEAAGAEPPDVQKQVADAVEEATKKLTKEHEKALAAQKRELTVQFSAEREFLAAGAKPEFVRMLDLSEVTEEGVKEKVAAFLKDNPEIVAKKEPQPPVPPVAGPSGRPGSDGKPVTNVRDATQILTDEMAKQGITFDS